MIDLDEIERAARNPWYCRSSQDDNFLIGTIVELITRLRQAEKDAARYRWALDNCLLGIGRNGATWDLQFEGPAPDHIGQVSGAIDEAMQCK